MEITIISRETAHIDNIEKGDYFITDNLLGEDDLWQVVSYGSVYYSYRVRDGFLYGCYKSVTGLLMGFSKVRKVEVVESNIKVKEL